MRTLPILMSPRRFVIALATLAVASGFTSMANAQFDRTAVSVLGNDTNDCRVVTPCRSFAVAVSHTNPGGEVVALDSAGYGAFTADRTITVQAAPGVYAGITAKTGYGVQITAGATDHIVLRGLTINGFGTGTAGIAFTGGGAEVQVENCLITGFTSWGIITFFPLRVQDTIVRDSTIGIHIDNAGAPVNATLERVQVQGSSDTGVFAWRNSVVAVRDSVVSLSGIGFHASGGVLNIEKGLATENATGVSAAPFFSSAGTVRMSNTMVVNNTTGVNVAGGTVETWLNNRIRGNTTDLTGGSLTTVSPK